MRIKFDKLRDAGFHVDFDEVREVVEIHGNGRSIFDRIDGGALHDRIAREFGMTDFEVEGALGKMLVEIERTLIMRLVD